MEFDISVVKQLKNLRDYYLLLIHLFLSPKKKMKNIWTWDIFIKIYYLLVDQKLTKKKWLKNDHFIIYELIYTPQGVCFFKPLKLPNINFIFKKKEVTRKQKQ